MKRLTTCVVLLWIAGCGSAAIKENTDAQDASTPGKEAAPAQTEAELDKAIVDSSEAIRLDPTDPLAYFNRGRAYDSRGAYYKANLGSSGRQKQQDDYNKAVADFTEAIQLNPDYAGAYRHRGNAHYYESEHDKAIADFSEAIRIKPEDVLTHLLRGFAYAYKHQFDKAIADYSEAIRLDPAHAVAYYNRGLAYRARGDKVKAEADGARARELGFKD